MRAWDGNIASLRAQYLFDLAAVCNCPPPVVDAMRVTDFARLITGLDQMRQREAG